MKKKEVKELRINARGLSVPGPRMMVETALADATCELLRVVVSHQDAVDDLKAYLEAHGGRVDIVDQIGDDYHIVADVARFERPVAPGGAAADATEKPGAR